MVWAIKNKILTAPPYHPSVQWSHLTSSHTEVQFIIQKGWSLLYIATYVPCPSSAHQSEHGTRHCSGHEPWCEYRCVRSACASSLQEHSNSEWLHRDHFSRLPEQKSMYLFQWLHTILKITLYEDKHILNSLAPGGFDYSLKLVNFKLISTINVLSIFCEIAVRWMP